MRRVKSLAARFGRLSATDRRLIAQAGVMVIVSRVALWTTGVRGARAAVRRAARLLGAADSRRAPWAVAAVSRRLPGATCLTQALALQALLDRAGRPCRVEIGVATAGGFTAHAWVVCGNEIVLGDARLEQFQRVAIFE